MNRFIAFNDYEFNIKYGYEDPYLQDDNLDISIEEMYRQELKDIVNKMSLWTGVPVETILEDSNLKYGFDKDKNIIILGVSDNAFN